MYSQTPPWKTRPFYYTFPIIDENDSASQEAGVSSIPALTYFSRKCERKCASYIQLATHWLKLILTFVDFLRFWDFWKHRSSIECDIYVWQVSSRLGCRDTCHILIWFAGTKFVYFSEATMSLKQWLINETLETPTRNALVSKTNLTLHTGHT